MPRKPIKPAKDRPFVYEDPCGLYPARSRRKGEIYLACHECDKKVRQGCLSDDPTEIRKTEGKVWLTERRECGRDQAWMDIHGTWRNR